MLSTFRSRISAVSARMADIVRGGDGMDRPSVEDGKAEQEATAQLANEDKAPERPVAEHATPSSPSPLPDAQSAGSRAQTVSPPSSLSSLDDLEMPPTPKVSNNTVLLYGNC